jgi:Domain of unknown function (DUF4136)
VSLLRSAPCLLAAALLLACASNDAIPVSTNFDPLVRFPAEATFVWDAAANKLPDDPAIDRETTDALLKGVANDAFAARGYRVAEGASADFRLSYQYVVHTYIGPDVSRSMGSISLLLADHASGRRVWMGFGRAEIHVGLSLEERRARLSDAMTRMLENFPPAQRPAS